MLSSTEMKNMQNFGCPVGYVAQINGCVPTGTKDPLCYGVGYRVSQLRTDAGLSATRLGLISTLKGNSLSQIEDGIRTPRIDTVEQIGRALDVSPSWIAFGHEGFAPFQQRRPRDPVPLDAPIPNAAERPSTERYKSVGDRCRRIRMLRGLSLRVAAKAAGISHESLNLIEKGSTIPLVATCERLAVAFDVAPAWLTYGEGEVPEGLEPARGLMTPV